MEGEAKNVILIVDSSMWIDLFQCDLLTKIVLLPYQIKVPDFVWEELIVPPDEELERLGLAAETFTMDEVTEIQKVRAGRSGLSVADASNIVLGLRFMRNARVVYLATHDAKLRQEAERRGIACKDALELLDEMVVEAVIEPVAASMIAPELVRGKNNPRRVPMLISKWLARDRR